MDLRNLYDFDSMSRQDLIEKIIQLDKENQDLAESLYTEERRANSVTKALLALEKERGVVDAIEDKTPDFLPNWLIDEQEGDMGQTSKR